MSFILKNLLAEDVVGDDDDDGGDDEHALASDHKLKKIKIFSRYVSLHECRMYRLLRFM